MAEERSQEERGTWRRSLEGPETRLRQQLRRKPRLFNGMVEGRGGPTGCRAPYQMSKKNIEMCISGAGIEFGIGASVGGLSQHDWKKGLRH